MTGKAAAAPTSSLRAHSRGRLAPVALTYDWRCWTNNAEPEIRNRGLRVGSMIGENVDP